MPEDYAISATTMADEDLCRAVGETLDAHYPGHPWRVGVDLDVGSITVELGYPCPEIPNATFGYRLHPQTLMGSGGVRRVMQAGGELLERYGLSRGAATADSYAQAEEHGLILDGSRDVEWMRKRRGV